MSIDTATIKTPFFVVSMTLMLFFCILNHIRRKYFPLSQKILSLFLCSIFGIMWIGANIGLVYGNLTCTIGAFFVYIFFAISISAALFKTFYTFVRYKLENEYTLLLTDSEKDSTNFIQKSHFFKHQNFWKSSKPFIIVETITFLFASTIISIFYKLDGTLYVTSPGINECRRFGTIISFGILAICGTISIIAFIILFIKNKINTWIDGLSEFRELKALAIIWIISFIIWLVLSEINNVTIKDLSVLAPVMGSILDVVFIGGWTILDTFSKKNKCQLLTDEIALNEMGEPKDEGTNLNERKGIGELFDLIMNTPKYKSEFERYLRGTLCIENLLFYEKVHSFKNLCKEGKDSSKEAILIYQLFFDQENEENIELNLDSKMVKEFKEGFIKAQETSSLNDPTLFDKPLDYITEEYLKKDSILKWSLSNHFPKELRNYKIDF